MGLPAYGVLTLVGTASQQPDPETHFEAWSEYVTTDWFYASHIGASILGLALGTLGVVGLGVALTDGGRPRAALGAVVLHVFGAAVLFALFGVAAFVQPAIGSAFLDGDDGARDWYADVFHDPRTLVPAATGLLLFSAASILLARALAEDEDSIPGGQVEPHADNARVREIYERSRAWFHASVGGPRAITRAAPKAPLKAEKSDGGGGGGGDDESNDDTDGGGGGDNVGAVGAAASWEKNKKKRQAEEEEEEEDVEEEEEGWGEPRSRINVRDYKRQRAQAGIPNQGAVRNVEDELRAANERVAAMKEIIQKSDDRDYQLRLQALEEFRENSERDHRLRMQALEELRENRKRDQEFKMRLLELEMSRGENANAGNQGLAGLLSGNLPPELREGLLRFLLKGSDGGGGGGASSTDP